MLGPGIRVLNTRNGRVVLSDGQPCPPRDTRGGAKAGHLDVMAVRAK